MRILDFRLTPVKTELKKPFVTNIRRVESIESVLLTLICDDYSIGFGEAPPTVAITGEDIQSIKQDISNKILPALYDIELTNSEIFEALNASTPHSTSAKACVDMAIYDLLAKSANQPLYKYLSGEAKHLRTNLTISLGEHDTMLQDAVEADRDGFGILKVKVGKGVDESIKIIKSIRNALPNSIIRIDANQAWDVKSALKIIDNITGCNIELVEQPVLSTDLAGLREITAHSSIKVLADESVFSADDAKRVLENRMADFINIKLMKSGGIYNASKIVKIAKEYNAKIMMGSMLESVVSVSAAVHFAMCDESICFYDLDGPLLAKPSSLPHSMVFKKDTISLKEAYGLGIGD